MKSLVIYYSLLGHNKKIAEEISREEDCYILVFAPGNILRCFQFFLNHKKLRKKSIKADLSNFNPIIICGPIWRKKPATTIKILIEMNDIKEKSIKSHFTYTQDYLDTEKFQRDLIEKKGAFLTDIKFLCKSQK